jgi:predicted RNase H-like nuclease (RuvC/YqgF family)
VLQVKDIEIESQQKKIECFMTKVRDLNKKLKGNPDHSKLEQYQKTFAELKTEPQYQKDLKSNSDDLKLEVYQKTISELKAELKQQKDLVLELKNENNNLNQELRSNRVNPGKLQQKNIAEQKMELQQQKEKIMELRKEIIYWINEKKFQSTTNANQRYVASQNEIPNDEDNAEQPPINIGMQSPNQETQRALKTCKVKLRT